MLFEAENLACRRGMRVVFRDVGFALAGGDVLLVTGANGSGKSSLLRVLAGLLPGLHGNLRWGGEMLDWAHHRTRLHYIGHQDAVKPELSVDEMLGYWNGLQREVDRSVLLRAFGLDGQVGKYVRHLSAGQKRRLALARLAMRDAALWLLDEPATSLDPAGQELLACLIGEHRTKGGIAIIAAHHEIDLPNAKRLSLAGRNA